MGEINSEKIREIREKEGLSLEEFGSRIGLSGTAISKMEKGGGARPSTVKKIHDVFKVNVGTLFKGGVQAGVKPADNIEVAEKRDIYIKDTEGEGAKITDLLIRAAEVLESGSVFRQALAANINALHLAIHSEEKILSLQGRIDYLEGQNKSLESRLAAVEEKLKGG